MHSIVKETFLIIMMVTIAMLMYFILFGSWDANDVSTPNAVEFGYESGTATVMTRGRAWQGLLWYSARVVENPIAFYYFNYCLTPNVHSTDYLDLELGTRIYNKTDIKDIKVSDYQNQGASVTATLEDYMHFPSEYSGNAPTTINDFGATHYHYKAMGSDDGI